MVSIPAVSVEDYLEQLPAERRAVVSAVRKMVKQHLPKGYRERSNWGMICYVVPLEESGPTYNGQPLCYASIAAQKNHYALYLMAAYMEPALTKELQEAFKRAGKRLDMGKSCVRFKSLEALPLDELGQIVASMPMADFIERYKAIHAGTKTAAKRKGPTAAKKAAKATSSTRATKNGPRK